jgi:alkanesulfonate monooxygenase SsuD/methylene tetrahydromethanopterin reductase-like flavin-dependent oxidoreductase (luciferase family)
MTNMLPTAARNSTKALERCHNGRVELDKQGGRVDFALMTEPQLGGTYEDQLAAARWAEETGLIAYARSDHYYAKREPRPDATDAFAVLAGLARETSRIRLCVLVSPITFRHPAVLAKMAATIDQMSEGRLDLGVGTGWLDLEHDAFGLPFPSWDERFGRLEEALLYLQAAFADGPQTLSGRYYELDADVRPKPTGEIPIIVGGQGPVRTPRLAGTFADEYNHFVAPPGDLSPKIDRVRDTARRTGRDPDRITASVMGPVLVGSDEADYRRKVEEAAAARDDSPEELENRWMAHGIPMGPPDLVARALADLEAVGVSKYYVVHLDVSDLSGLDETFAILQEASSNGAHSR